MSPEKYAARIRADFAALRKPDTPALRAVRKQWSKTLKDADAEVVIEVARLLERSAAQSLKWPAYELVRFHPGAFAALTEAQIVDFAGRIASWYATDAFGTILTGALWAKGRLPDALIDRWSRADDRWLRRSALVATVGRNASVPSPAATLAICLRLAGDADDMVEKAVSWALRYLSQKEPEVVASFMAEHGEKFRPRVKREVRNKLSTGLKNPQRESAPPKE
jgi:3-methyladenine DNA glycosylase AlkD